ncbi:Glyoxalase-like domain protein [Roseimaritima multifibrata]|uniref:Glyoxalase-like domain protein n=1 Tax=Roseimaritima multifibrata TaxID=1930274 RepID=A0A517MI87_9BACT|nr:VOC family protein [Roseimaritima multifibrata]QDS94570.1 Glyoxalase-like domain protein [Roseimaritima multifibrata]
MNKKGLEMNPVCWFEIYVQDMPRATAFYETVLGVSLEHLPAPSGEIELMAFPMAMDRPGAAGALTKMDGVKSGGNSTLVYFSCEDCAMEASLVQAAGGSIQKPKTALGQYGFMVLAMDTEGNLFGLHSQK